MPEIITNVSKEYPEFIFKPLISPITTPFYFEKSTNPLEVEVLKLRKKYNDYYDWLRAMDVYNSYMEQIAPLYGGMDILLNSIRNGSIDNVYVPSPPTLKNKKKNRRLLSMSELPSKKIFPNTNYDGLDEIPHEVPEITTLHKPIKDKELKEAIRKATNSTSMEVRKNSLYKNRYKTISYGQDFIVDYYKKAELMSANEYGEIEQASLANQMKQYEMEKYLEDWEKDKPDVGYVYVRGRYISLAEKERMDLYKELHEAGIPILSILGESTDRKTIKMIRAQTGITEPMTEKELKKYRKKMKKQQKQGASKLRESMDNDKILSDILLGNKIDLSDDSILSFEFTDLQSKK